MKDFEPLDTPDFMEVGESFVAFCKTIARLRDPENGCPWDLEQDHTTLRKYMLEEAYEASTAMAEGPPAELCGELGDVLLQVLLNAQIACDNRTFTILEVIREINHKMIRRHPHIFGTAEQRKNRSIDQIMTKWHEIKATEKSAGEPTEKSAMEAEGVYKVHPASTQALRIGGVAKRLRFDWSTPGEVIANLKSEVEELDQAWNAGQGNLAAISDEIGDIYFSLAQVCRHLRLDPETVAYDGNRKFLKRFAKLERLACEDGVELGQVGHDVLSRLWERVKQ